MDFPLLDIKIVSSTANINKRHKVAISRNDFRFGIAELSPEQLRHNFWDDIKNSRLLARQPHNLKLLKAMASNPGSYVLVLGNGFEQQHLEVIIRAVSFLAHIESLNPLNYVFSEIKAPMTPDEYYAYLQSLGIKLNLIKP